MTNEHDIIVAKLGVALTIVRDSIGSDLTRTAAEEWLQQQFVTPPESEQPEKQEPFTGVLGGPHCTAIMPGRSLKYGDALQCFLKQGHDGPHDFRSMPGEPFKSEKDEFG
jgi:hypothetical protein